MKLPAFVVGFCDGAIEGSAREDGVFPCFEFDEEVDL